MDARSQEGDAGGATTGRLTWEQAVQWLRAQPGQEQLVRDCYYDDPIEDAVRRFHASEEFSATLDILGPVAGKRVLDVGAGRGIASYAFAREGALVTALEPDTSALVGTGAIRRWSEALGTPVRIVDRPGEALPFAQESFDIVYARAVLHHAADLGAFCREVKRVLRRGGCMLAVREHVISRPEELTVFQQRHPLHHLYGGERAYPLKEYLRAMRGAGLTVERRWGPWESVVNHAPVGRAELASHQRDVVVRRLGPLAGQLLWSRRVRAGLSSLMSIRDRTPGRHHAFLARRG